MPRMYDLDPMAQMRNGAARRALTPDPYGEDPDAFGASTMTASTPEAMPEPPAAPAGAPPPAASPAAIRHEGFGGYTYLFDPVTYEISILEDPKGKVPAGYVVPKNSGPYDAILKELAGAGKLGEDRPDPMAVDAMDQAAGDPSLLYDALNEGDAAFREAHPTSGTPDPGGIDTPYADRQMGDVPDPADVATPYADRQMAGGGDVADVAEPYAPPEAPAEDGDSLEGLEARMEEIKARISEKRAGVRDRVKKRRGAEATAPPAAGGGQAQAAPGGASGASYEGM